MTSTSNHAATALLAAGLLAASAAASVAQTIVIATDRQGSLMNRVGTAIAKTIADNTDLRAVVRPFAGPDAYMNSLNNGQTRFAVFTAPTAYVDVKGQNKAKRAYKNIRLLRSGANVIRLGFMVPKASNIQTIAELKGKKLPSDFGGHSVIELSIKTGLSAGGLTWDDVVKVPVTGVVDGVKSLGAGRTQATWGPVGMPAVREVNAQIGVRFLSFPDDPDTIAKMRKIMYPGLKIANFPKPIPPLSIVKPTNVISYDTYFVTHKGLDAALAKKILEGLWNGAGALTKSSPLMRGFDNSNAATELPMMPYHPAAADFYKQRKTWTEKVAAGQAASLTWVK